MKSIISIQSHVVYGHAGNSSAVFPMQRMGLEVWPIHTVQFSNHTQYQQGWTGQKFGADEIHSLMRMWRDTVRLSRQRRAMSSGGRSGKFSQIA